MEVFLIIAQFFSEDKCKYFRMFLKVKVSILECCAEYFPKIKESIQNVAQIFSGSKGDKFLNVLQNVFESKG